jgi:hypothetical protein
MGPHIHRWVPTHLLHRHMRGSSVLYFKKGLGHTPRFIFYIEFFCFCLSIPLLKSQVLSIHSKAANFSNVYAAQRMLF